MSLGVKVKVLREEKGMTQKELADASKITQATISRIEKGQVKQLKSEALRRLADALEVGVNYLIGQTTALTLDELPLASPPPSPERAEQSLTQYSISNIVRELRKLPSEARDQVAGFVRFLLEKEEQKRKALGEKITRLQESGKKEAGRQS